MRVVLPVLLLVVAGAVAAGCGEAPGGEGTEYEGIVSFNTTVTQDDLDETASFLRRYDEDLDFLVQESFPPTGVARLRTEDADFCAAVEAELGAKSYVDRVTCGARQETPAGDPEEPVSSE
jgi:hypothetical protein